MEINKEESKKLIQQEILSLLDGDIDNELDAMGDFYTIAEISKEVLLSFDKESLK